MALMHLAVDTLDHLDNFADSLDHLDILVDNLDHPGILDSLDHLGAGMLQAHPMLTEAAIRAALSYYADHQQEIDRYIAENEDEVD